MLNRVAEDFSTGHPKDGKACTFNSRRAYATNIIKDTISNPDMIFHQKRGILSYVTYWRESVKDMAHAVIVTVDKEHNGKIITSLISADRSADSTHAMSGLRSEIKKADALLYVSHNLHERLSKYLRPPSGARDSTLDTQLHPSGNSIIEDSLRGGNDVAGGGRGKCIPPLVAGALWTSPAGLRVLKFDGAVAPRVLKFDSGYAAEGCGGRL